MAMTMDLYDYGAQVSIAAPPSSAVFDATQFAQQGLASLTSPRTAFCLGNVPGCVERRWRSLKKIVRLWVDLFDRHNLLTYASAIALRMFIAAVACTLFGLGILGATHQQQLWQQTIGRRSSRRSSPTCSTGSTRP